MDKTTNNQLLFTITICQSFLQKWQKNQFKNCTKSNIFHESAHVLNLELKLTVKWHLILKRVAWPLPCFCFISLFSLQYVTHSKIWQVRKVWKIDICVNPIHILSVDMRPNKYDTLVFCRLTNLQLFWVTAVWLVFKTGALFSEA